MENLVNVNEGIIVISGIFFLALLRGCQFETSKVESAPETALECFFFWHYAARKKKEKKNHGAASFSIESLFSL